MRTQGGPKEIGNLVVRVFSANLVRLRRDRQWSQRVASAGLGVAESTWSQWESGSRFPPAHLLVLITTLFEVPVCGLFCSFSSCPHGLGATSGPCVMPGPASGTETADTIARQRRPCSPEKRLERRRASFTEREASSH